VAGCSTIYRRTVEQLPPGPEAELNLRLAQATQAENLAEKAGAMLLDSLQHNRPAATIQTDFDRLEAAAIDLERRVLAAADSAGRCVDRANAASQIEALGDRARSWLGYVRANRTSDLVRQLERLQVMINSHSRATSLNGAPGPVEFTTTLKHASCSLHRSMSREERRPSPERRGNLTTQTESGMLVPYEEVSSRVPGISGPGVVLGSG
jgi:hypothetical protein